MTGFLHDLLVTAAFAVTIAMVWWMHDPRTLFLCGVGGAMGFLTFRLLLQFTDGLFVPTLMAAVVMGIAAELFAKRRKIPAIIILAPSIYTLAPGSRMYETMLFLVHRNTPMALEKGVEAATIAAAMAFGVLLASLLSRAVQRNHARFVGDDRSMR